MFYYVQLWRRWTDSQPTITERVQAPSEGHAIVQVMRHHHLHYADRVWVHHSAQMPPALRVKYVSVKGKTRSWRQEYNPELTAMLVLASWLTDFAASLRARKKQRRHNTRAFLEG